MSRKPKKGYFVRGEFVTEGSQRDLELKRELKGTDQPSRTELKRESAELQKLGEGLLSLRADLLEKLKLGDKLEEAVTQGKRITDFEGRRRQMQYIGKLMRLADADVVQSVRTALTAQSSGSAQEILTLHQAESWRQRLLQSEDAIGEWFSHYPETDAQQLRALVRQARKDATLARPGEPARHGRAYRELFQLLREHLQEVPGHSPLDRGSAAVFHPSQEAS